MTGEAKYEEHVAAAHIANVFLDQPYADPDSDVCLLARQFLRSREAISTLLSENERLREALKPFAEIVCDSDDSDSEGAPDGRSIDGYWAAEAIRFGHLRRALAALTREPPRPFEEPQSGDTAPAKNATEA